MKRFVLSFAYVAAACVALASPVFAQTDAQFAKANQDYASGRFKEAITGYEDLVRSGQWSANLFYDLGNACFRAGDLGRSILNYERALALEPHHPEAEANLRIAREEARALELQPTSLERYLRFADAGRYTIAAAAAFWLGAFCVAGLIFARRRSTPLIMMSVFSTLAFAFLVALVFWSETGRRGHALAIVTSNGVEARVATADTANSVLALPPGSEIKIMNQRGDWVYAVLPNNLRGWIPAKSAEPVRL